MAVRKLKPKAAVVKPAKAAPETCFTVMPFGGWFDDYYESIYKPAIEHAGLGACRADDLYRPSTIVTDIWTYTKSAKLILADLSGKNPNVFYELGLGRVNTNGRTVYQGRYLLAWKSRPSSSHVLNIAFPPNAATSA